MGGYEILGACHVPEIIIPPNLTVIFLQSLGSYLDYSFETLCTTCCKRLAFGFAVHQTSTTRYENFVYKGLT